MTAPLANQTIPRKKAVDKDLARIVAVEEATRGLSRRLVAVGLAFLFLVGVGLAAALGQFGSETMIFIVVAAVVGGYMALNIGANDVANNVSPAVGAKALTMGGAILMAAICETAGALIAGADVVETISSGLINAQAMAGPQSFIVAMTAALLAAALWLNLATWVGAPVSTTHSIVGAVMGAGAMAAGIDAVSWGMMGKIAASWVISPLLGGSFAALMLYAIKTLILDRDDKINAAARWVPMLIAVMSAAFTLYLAMKGLKNVWKPTVMTASMVAISAFAVTWALVHPIVKRRSLQLENRRKSVVSLFGIPLVVSAALLSFAHGANDVANAVGPLAAIVGVLGGADIGGKVAVPLWVLLVGALGISIGLALFGPALVRTVGQEITKLDPARAFCVALSAAVTVIAASTMGLPVSSTHIAVGAVFGVGFLREYFANSKPAPNPDKLLRKAAERGVSPEDLLREKTYKAERRKLVRRRHVLSIAAAWLITVPFSAAVAAGLFLLMEMVF